MNMVDECTSENFSIIQDAKNRDLVPLPVGYCCCCCCFWFFFSLVLFSFHFHYFSYFVPKSHEVGPGPEFERVGFNLLGRSPLVSHFLRMKELMGKEEQAIQAVGRTEIAKLPYPLF